MRQERKGKQEEGRKAKRVAVLPLEMEPLAGVLRDGRAEVLLVYRCTLSEEPRTHHMVE